MSLAVGRADGRMRARIACAQSGLPKAPQISRPNRRSSGNSLLRDQLLAEHCRAPTPRPPARSGTTSAYRQGLQDCSTTARRKEAPRSFPAASTTAAELCHVPGAGRHRCTHRYHHVHIQRQGRHHQLPSFGYDHDDRHIQAGACTRAPQPHRILGGTFPRAWRPVAGMGSSSSCSSASCCLVHDGRDDNLDGADQRYVGVGSCCRWWWGPGGGVSASNVGNGGGGGAGGVVYDAAYPVTPGAGLTVVIGAGKGGRRRQPRQWFERLATVALQRSTLLLL